MSMKPVRIPDLRAMKGTGTKIAVLTAYDATMARLMDRAGIDVILVGDSLGMVIQGHRSTLPVHLDDVLYHTRCVLAGCARPLVIADMPLSNRAAVSEPSRAATFASAARTVGLP